MYIFSNKANYKNKSKPKEEYDEKIFNKTQNNI